MKRIRQILTPQDDLTCNFGIFGLQRRLLEAGLKPAAYEPQRMTAKTGYVLSKLHLVRNVMQRTGDAFFVQAHGLSEPMMFPFSYLNEIVIYAWDVWPPKYDGWERMLRRNRIRLAFISSRGSSEEMQRRISQMKVMWMPEGVEHEHFATTTLLKDRPADVLELGRRYSVYHGKIVGTLKASGRVHRYQEGPEPLYRTIPTLAKGYGEAKISICFPASMTHPHRAGNLQTATQRYFESIASKCVLVGHAPPELEELFGFNPVVEADEADPGGQLIAILDELDRYQLMVERNYARLLEVGTWEKRAKQIVEALASEGYQV